MSTTAIVIEHLISGIQAFLWLAFFVFAAFGFEWVNLDFLKNYSTQLSIVALAIVYPLGIFIDELADHLLKKWSHRIRCVRFQKENISSSYKEVSAFLLLQSAKDNFLTSYFNYIRMRVRISRSAAINCLLLSIAVVSFTFVRSSCGWKMLLIEIVVGGCLTSLSLWSWSRVTDTFAKQVARAYKAQRSANDGLQPAA